MPTTMTTMTKQQKQHLEFSKSLLTKNAAERNGGMRRSVSKTRARRNADGKNDIEIRIDDDEEMQLQDDIVDNGNEEQLLVETNEEEEQQQEAPNGEDMEEDDEPTSQEPFKKPLPPASTTTQQRTGQQQLQVTREPIVRDAAQRLSQAIRKLKNPDLHIRKMGELNEQEKKEKEERWEALKNDARGTPKCESWVSFLSPKVILLDESPHSRGFGCTWWFGMNKSTGEKMERLTIQQYATKLQPMSTSGYGNKGSGKKISLSKAELEALINKLPEIMDAYVKDAETYEYLFEKVIQERRKEESVTGSSGGGYGRGGYSKTRHYGPKY